MIKAIAVLLLLVSLTGIILCGAIGAGFYGPVNSNSLWLVLAGDIVFISTAFFAVYLILKDN